MAGESTATVALGFVAVSVPAETCICVRREFKCRARKKTFALPARVNTHVSAPCHAIDMVRLRGMFVALGEPQSVRESA
jgi:hypothetical protein